MKVVGFTALHYGKDYLAYAIRSIIDHIDEYHVAYTAIGSHGHRTQIPCPETRDELYAIASAAAGNKLHWHEGEWPYEGAQRDSIHEYAPDADAIIVCDADEIWPDGMVQKAISRTIQYPTIKQFRAEMCHFWRSFYRCILHDPSYPIRVINPRGTDDKVFYIDAHRKDYIEGVDHRLMIAHLGYAQRPEIVQYKQLTHGHRNEWRKDVDWFADKYLANAQTDTHPVGSEYWNPERVDPLDYMPRWMQEHPYYHMQVIE